MQADPCFMCVMEQYDIEKLQDDNFWFERKNEFYPDDEWGSSVKVCTKCKNIILAYKQKKLI